MSTWTRLVELEAVHNFRDLGGYATASGGTVRPGLLYRADGLYRLSAADVETLRPLGLRTVIDLRSANEISERGRFPVDDHPVEFHHLPVIEAVWADDEVPSGDDEHETVHFLVGKYLEMFDEGERAIARALEVLAEPDAMPAVFHCAAGKDRTGILAAVVLSLVGVSDADIAHDYALSAEAMVRMRDWFLANQPDLVDMMERPKAAYVAAPAAAMEGLLALLVMQHGSMETYVRSLGVRESTIATLRERLVDPG